MCGIFGYLGYKKNPAKIVFQGLKTLEYRGYDSWGIGFVNNGRLTVHKKVGKLPKDSLDLTSESIAVGHTRWATHGGVTQANAHPHFDCTGKLALVHNGIVENYQELKRKLLKTHKFTSTTDTEVIIHLIEEEAAKKPFAEAVRTAFKQLEGANAIVVLDSTSRTLVGAKTGSPLVLGIGKGEYFLASDSVAFLPYTKKAYFIPEGFLVSVRDSQVINFDIKNGKKTPLKPQKITWGQKAAELSGFAHFMLKEIFEQPKVLKNLLDDAKMIEKMAKIINSAFGTFIVGCGTASYAALFAQYLFSTIAKKHVNFSIGSEFAYLEHYLTPASLVMAISQSGETMDVLESIQTAKSHKSKVMAIVNVEGSTLWRMVDFRVPLKAGPEVAVCATKSFIAMIGNVLLLAYATVRRIRLGRELILTAAEDIQKNILKQSQLNKVQKLAKKLKKSEHIYIIGRGLSYAAALEATLKIKECTYIHSEGFAGGELKHGVIALIEKGTPCIVFAPNDETKGATLSNAAELKARGGYIIGIAPENNEIFDYYFEVSDLGPATIIPSVVYAQLLAYFLATEKGFDPDKPRNLAKSVTVK